MRLGSIALLAALALPTTLVAQGSKHGKDISIAARFGTLGLGAEISKLVNSHIGIRVGANTFSYDRSIDQTDINFDATLKMKAVTGLVDLYLKGRGSFHLTGGIITNPVEVTAIGVPKQSGTFTINGRVYNTAQVGTLTGSGEWPKTSPYAGLGWGTPANSHSALKFIFDLGAAIGKPTIALTATGAANNAQLQADLNSQIVETQKDVDKYAKVYPVISFGLAYRF